MSCSCRRTTASAPARSTPLSASRRTSTRQGAERRDRNGCKAQMPGLRLHARRGRGHRAGKSRSRRHARSTSGRACQIRPRRIFLAGTSCARCPGRQRGAGRSGRSRCPSDGGWPRATPTRAGWPARSACFVITLGSRGCRRGSSSGRRPRNLSFQMAAGGRKSRKLEAATRSMPRRGRRGPQCHERRRRFGVQDAPQFLVNSQTWLRARPVSCSEPRTDIVVAAAPYIRHHSRSLIIHGRRMHGPLFKYLC